MDVEAAIAALRPLLERAPVRLAFLFGSAARDRLHAHSDLDIAILPDRDLTLEEELDLQATLVRAAQREVDLVRLDRADVLLSWQVALHGVLLVERDPGEASQFRARAALAWAELRPLWERSAEHFRRRLAGRMP